VFFGFPEIAAAAPVLDFPAEVVDGEQVEVTISGVAPGQTVGAIAARLQGPGICPPVPGDCLEVRVGLRVLMSPTAADANGVATAQTTVLGTGTWYVQAMAIGATAEVSPVSTVVSYDPEEDTDGDGASNANELVAGTPPFVADADGDGIADGEDLWPFLPNPADPFVPDDLVVSDPAVSLPDPEFDTVGNQVAWQDRDGLELWVADVDPVNGTLSPPDGRGTLIATNVVPISRVRNGPEWVQTATGGQVLYGDASTGVERIVAASNVGGTWVSRNIAVGVGPIGSLDANDPFPRVHYAEYYGPGADRYRTQYLDDPGSDLGYADDLKWGRWVEGSDKLVGLVDQGGVLQVSEVDPATGTSVLRTNSAVSKRNVFGWQAPEYGVEAFFHSSGPVGSDTPLQIDVFLDDGAGGWTHHDTITGPPAFPYIVSPEPLVVNGRSYISFLASNAPLNRNNGQSEVWLVDIDPATQFGRRLSDMPGAVLKDPEPAVFGNNALVYYTEVVGRDRVVHRTLTGL
jgi:hypothetical protein